MTIPTERTEDDFVTFKDLGTISSTFDQKLGQLWGAHTNSNAIIKELSASVKKMSEERSETDVLVKHMHDSMITDIDGNPGFIEVMHDLSDAVKDLKKEQKSVPWKVMIAGAATGGTFVGAAFWALFKAMG